VNVFARKVASSLSALRPVGRVGSERRVCPVLARRRLQDFAPNQRTTGIPGYNLFGAPSSKLGQLPLVDKLFNSD